VESKKQQLLAETSQKRDALLKNVDDKAAELKTKISAAENLIKQKEQEIKNKADEKVKVVEKQGQKQLQKQLKGLFKGK
jgi:hypothetical protein